MKDFAVIMGTHHPKEHKRLVKAYLQDHAELLKAAPDTHNVLDLSHSLDDMLLECCVVCFGVEMNSGMSLREQSYRRIGARKTIP